jgi:hypothetical protein
VAATNAVALFSPMLHKKDGKMAKWRETFAFLEIALRRRI